MPAPAAAPCTRADNPDFCLLLQVVNAYNRRRTLPKRVRPRQRRPQVPEQALLTRQDSSELLCVGDLNAFRDTIRDNLDAHVNKFGDNLNAHVNKLGDEFDALGDKIDALGDKIGDRLDARIQVSVTTAAFVLVMYTADKWLPGLLELIRVVR